jgi:DNA-damage-inducible protein J
MTDKTETVRARVTEGLKKDAESILGNMGMNLSDAIRIFLTQIVIRKAFPMDIISEQKPQDDKEIVSLALSNTDDQSFINQAKFLWKKILPPIAHSERLSERMGELASLLSKPAATLMARQERLSILVADHQEFISKQKDKPNNEDTYKKELFLYLDEVIKVVDEIKRLKIECVAIDDEMKEIMKGFKK